jgi:hypothetical protein
MLIGEPQGAHEMVVNSGPSGWDDEPTVVFDDNVGADRFDAQGGAIGGHLDLAGTEPQLVPQGLRNYHSSGPVDGRPHAKTIP